MPEVTSKVMASSSFVLGTEDEVEKDKSVFPASPMGVGGARFLCGTICQVVSWAPGLGVHPAWCHHETLP